MKYLLLIYGDEKVWDDAGRDECYSESAELARELHAEGKLLGTNALMPVATATSVRAESGKSIITDGPFAETREQLGGYFLIEARDLDEAIEIAKRIPGGRLGTVEIRPVHEVAGLPT
ncbi:MAG: YciI family protein [Thermomicrobiales bacterium]